MSSGWRWASARSIGTSHAKSGTECQDFASCTVVAGAQGAVLSIAVSDGAGSASHAAHGSLLACGGFQRAASEFLASRGGVDAVGDDDVFDWLDTTRERINAFASGRGIRPRDCAATLVAVLADDAGTIVVHVGDGAAVVRQRGQETWQVPSWPYQGEYAGTTTFITDDPSPRVEIVRLAFPVDSAAVFTDGLERMVLNHSTREASQVFFDQMTAPIRALERSGRDRTLSRALGHYLGGPAICRRTDDDKTLVLAVRP